jgi:enediyne biosynthesis protein E4
MDGLTYLVTSLGDQGRDAAKANAHLTPNQGVLRLPSSSRRSSVLFAVALTLGLGGCLSSTEGPPTESRRGDTEETTATNGPIQLVDATASSNIEFIHCDGSSGRRYIMETVTAGLALFDYDGDGLIDIYFLNGAPLPGCEASETPTNTLYRNLGGWNFADVTQDVGVGDTGFGLGVAVADYDNDGDPDLFVNNFGPNVLYRNNGDGTFDDATAAANVGGGDRFGAGACFLDVDADGLLDLYVANYLRFTFDTHHVAMEGKKGDIPVYVGPLEYPFEPDLLYRNTGGGVFEDVSEQSGVGQLAGSGMGMVACDYDNDGDTDIFTLNDVYQNYLWENDGTGRFRDIGVLSGAAYDGSGDELGSMGIDCGDYNNDGWLDFIMTSYQNEVPVLYRNCANGSLEDVTLMAGVGKRAFSHVNWGVGFVDLDNDGHRDLFIANGHLMDNVGQFDDTTSYRARNVVLRNLGQGKFEDVSDGCGSGLLPSKSSRAAVFDDLDNDGDVDVVILNSREGPTLLRNETLSENHWLQIRLRGVRSNRDGVGARVTVEAGGLTQTAEVHSGRGYQSHFGTRLQFGLGERSRVDCVRVRWLGGGTDEFRDVAVDQLLVVTEGDGA